MKWFVFAIILIAVVGIWLWRARGRQKRNDEAPASIVILLRAPIALNAYLLAELLSKESGRNVRAIDMNSPPADEDSDQPVGDMVTGASPHFIAHINEVTYVFHNLSTPYMKDPIRASDAIEELRLRHAVREHLAWVSMDILEPKAAISENYRFVARILAHLIGPNCLALYHPPLNQFVPCGEETVAQLKSDDPIQSVFSGMPFLPVILIDDDEPRIRAAKAEAKNRFSEFEAAFDKREGTDFSIKALISEGGNAEHIWIEVDQILPERIEGRLGNEPVNLGDLRLGSRINVEKSEIEDWAYMRGETRVGMFIFGAMQQIEAEKTPKR